MKNFLLAIVFVSFLPSCAYFNCREARDVVSNVQTATTLFTGVVDVIEQTAEDTSIDVSGISDVEDAVEYVNTGLGIVEDGLGLCNEGTEVADYIRTAVKVANFIVSILSAFGVDMPEDLTASLNIITAFAN